MDRDQALKLLKGGEDGVEEWNRRRGEGEEIPDLGEANLHEANLSGADLRGANLRDTNLRGADLLGANLSETKGLTRAQISLATTDDSTLLPDSLP